LQRGRIEYEPGPVNLQMLADNTVSLLGGAAEGKQIQLQQTIDKSLFIQADEHMIDTVIRNLTSNALKFTPEGGQITISAQNGHSDDEGNWIEVSINDTGVGISEKDMELLFKIEHHHTTPGTAKEQGTGLGLILCQEMVEKNGGKIWIESEIGQGTTVKFTVPASDE
jgi:signal transduction histidine kinase